MINIDFKRLIAWLLPVNLRTAVHFAWLQALYAPLQTVYGLFNARRNANLYALSVTPQVCSLEKMLNDRYDSIQRRIYITDAIHISCVYIYLEEEQKPLFISGSTPVYIYGEAEIDASRKIDFTVHVPFLNHLNSKEMRALLNTYKLAGKRYEITA
jgi:hypothetical protein